MERNDLLRQVATGSFIFLMAFFAYIWKLSESLPEKEARGLGLTVIIMGQLAILPALVDKQRISIRRVRMNRFLAAIMAIAVVGYAILMYVPSLAEIIHIAPITPIDWIMTGFLSFAVFGLAELTKYGGHRTTNDPDSANPRLMP